MRSEFPMSVGLTTKLIAALVFLMVSASSLTAKGWRGIVPFHSTREQVKTLLGEPPPPPENGTRFYTLNEGRYIYFLEDGEVYIVFAQEDFPSKDCRVRPGTVLMIQVTPAKPTKLDELQIDLSKFRKVDPSDPPGMGYEGYVNEHEGLMIRAFKGKVEQVIY